MKFTVHYVFICISLFFLIASSKFQSSIDEICGSKNISAYCGYKEEIILCDNCTEKAGVIYRLNEDHWLFFINIKYISGEFNVKMEGYNLKRSDIVKEKFAYILHLENPKLNELICLEKPKLLDNMNIKVNVLLLTDENVYSKVPQQVKLADNCASFENKTECINSNVTCDEIIVKDTKTIIVENFVIQHCDKDWIFEAGDDNNQFELIISPPMKVFNGSDISLTLPKNFIIQDITWIAIKFGKSEKTSITFKPADFIIPPDVTVLKNMTTGQITTPFYLPKMTTLASINKVNAIPTSSTIIHSPNWFTLLLIIIPKLIYQFYY